MAASGVNQRLIPLSDRNGWGRALEGIPHAFAHTWASCSAMHLTTGWPTFLWTWERGGSRAVCAVAERGRLGQVDVVTPFGFGGIVGIDVGPSVLESWSSFARERDYVCGYVGLNPVLAPEACHRSPDYVAYNDVYVLELHLGIDALSERLSRNRRRQLEVFERERPRLVDDQERLGEYFEGSVDAFLRAKDATSTYAFKKESWRRLLGTDGTLLLGVEEPGGKVVAVYLFAFTSYCGEALFAVSDPAGSAYSAALTWFGAVRLCERGVPLLNLGGGVRRGDGIARFKERFGAQCLPLGALRQVYRQEAYASLCRRVGADPADRSGFFPPYQAPRFGVDLTD